MQDTSKLLPALGEVALAFALGLFGSALLFTLAMVLWMRGHKPSLPAD